MCACVYMQKHVSVVSEFLLALVAVHGRCMRGFSLSLCSPACFLLLLALAPARIRVLANLCLCQRGARGAPETTGAGTGVLGGVGAATADGGRHAKQPMHHQGAARPINRREGCLCRCPCLLRAVTSRDMSSMSCHVSCSDVPRHVCLECLVFVSSGPHRQGTECSLIPSQSLPFLWLQRAPRLKRLPSLTRANRRCSPTSTAFQLFHPLLRAWPWVQGERSMQVIGYQGRD